MKKQRIFDMINIQTYIIMHLRHEIDSWYLKLEINLP